MYTLNSFETPTWLREENHSHLKHVSSERILYQNDMIENQPQKSTRMVEHCNARASENAKLWFFFFCCCNIFYLIQEKLVE